MLLYRMEPCSLVNLSPRQLIHNLSEAKGTRERVDKETRSCAMLLRRMKPCSLVNLSPRQLIHNPSKMSEILSIHLSEFPTSEATKRNYLIMSIYK